MSVESEILRIQHNIASAYAKVSEKGGEVPLQPASANLAAAIASVPGGSELTAGDGLSKEGDTLSVTTPVRGIVTQAEFDALTEAQKNSGLYVISDGGGGGSGGGESAGEVHSTEETRIGTWIDGKPLYRKVIELTLPSTASGSSSYSGHTLPAEINPVNYYGMCISTNGHKMPLYGGNYTYAVINPANQIYVAAFQGDYASALLILTVEYTKTTDGSFEW